VYLSTPRLTCIRHVSAAFGAPRKKSTAVGQGTRIRARAHRCVV